MGPRVSTILISALVVIGLDQWTKRLAQANLSTRPPQEFLGGLFRLTYGENPGAFMSLGENLPPAWRTFIFTFLVFAFLIYFFFYLVNNQYLDLTALIFGGLVLGGGTGNLIDRLVNAGGVIDFMVIRLGPLQTGIFNVADMAIMVGVFGLFFFGQRVIDEDPKEEESVVES